MTRRLLLSYIGLAVLILAMLEIPLAVLGSRRLNGLAISQDEKVATGLAIAASQDFEQNQVGNLTAVVLHYRDVTGGEVEIVDATGRVVATADDDHDNDALGPAAPFVRSAQNGVLSGGIAADEGQPTVFAAAPIGVPGARSGVVLLSISASSAVHRIHLFWGALAGFALAVLVAAVLIGRWMTSTVSRPLERLGRTVSALGETDLGVRADVTDGPVEVKALAEQFNQMANRLTELVKVQSRFVADASHQLRSPLTALRLRIENLEADLPSDRRPAVTAVGDEVQRLSRLVDGLISLGDADAAPRERVTVDVGQVIEERCVAWAALAQERRVLLDGPPPGESHRLAALVPGDLDQILDNLLANALDVSPEGARITVRVHDLDTSGFEVHIVDEGPGMTDEELGRAFDRFWRGSETAGFHGGLGLAIVRQLAIRNDLQITLSSGPTGGLDASIGVRQTRRRRTGRQPQPT